MVEHSGTDPLCAVIGANTRRIREELRISQSGLAAAISARGHSSWTAATVSNLETGRRNVSLSELADLVDLLEVTLAKVLSLPSEADPLVRSRGRALTQQGRPEIVADAKWEPQGELGVAMRAARQRRLEDNVWGAIMGGHPTPADRSALEAASLEVFGRSLLDERDFRATQKPVGRIQPAVLGHATRAIINALSKHLTREDRAKTQHPQSREKE